MSGRGVRAIVQHDRRYFIGGSDARVIMGNDESALIRLWREKRGEVEPRDLSSNLVVQLGVATEELNRHDAHGLSLCKRHPIVLGQAKVPEKSDDRVLLTACRHNHEQLGGPGPGPCLTGLKQAAR